jgi:hypothetical protein
MERLGVHHFDMSGSTRPIQQAQLKTQALDGRETRMERAACVRSLTNLQKMRRIKFAGVLHKRFRTRASTTTRTYVRTKTRRLTWLLAPAINEPY